MAGNEKYMISVEEAIEKVLSIVPVLGTEENPSLIVSAR